MLGLSNLHWDPFGVLASHGWVVDMRVGGLAPVHPCVGSVGFPDDEVVGQGARDGRVSTEPTVGGGGRVALGLTRQDYLFSLSHLLCYWLTGEHRTGWGGGRGVHNGEDILTGLRALQTNRQAGGWL